MPRNPLVAAFSALERAQTTHLRAEEAARRAREARNECVFRAIELGASYRRVGEVIGVSGAAVYALCRKAGRLGPRRVETLEEDA